MSLFGKTEETCRGGSYKNKTEKPVAASRDTGAAAKILGGGCAKCNALEAATVQALRELGLDTTIDHVKDYAEIASYGVMSTPALVYNGKLLSFGRVLRAEEIKKLLAK